MSGFYRQGGTYRIDKDPDDELPYGMQWYDFLRGSDKYWKPRTFVRPGEIRTPSQESLNAHRYIATKAGTTGVQEPEWPTDAGEEVTDGGVVWTENGAEDTIDTSTWEAGGLTASNAGIDPTGYVSVVTLAGLTIGQEYTVTNSIVSAQGKKKDRSFIVVCKPE